jgi:hypothetical protein
MFSSDIARAVSRAKGRDEITEARSPDTAERLAARACGKSRKEEKMSDEDQILSRTQVLELLSQKAREGSTSAMIALERALRIGDDKAPDEDDFIEELIQSGIRRAEVSRQGEGRAA